MKQFFTLVFGGLGIIAVCVFIAFASGSAWNMLRLHGDLDGTLVSGMRRYVRYTASQEEDLISSATVSLPHATNGVISASTYLVKDMKTGEVVVSHDPDRLVPVASLTKLVTAVVATKLIRPYATITLTPGIIGTYGNTAQFRVGEVLGLNELLYPLLMVSSNDAAEALANKAGRTHFINEMNSFVQSIGAYRTYFADPSGLSPQNESTASDVALIIDWIRINKPELLAMTTLKSKTVRAHTWTNPTHFLNWSNYLGGKNGYTDEANRTGAAVFSLGPKHDPYVIVVLGSASRDVDVIQLLSKVKN